jgi:sugar O-acyltransferase (sialic acid O-acetyltransferase NeuD family)
MQRLAIIGSSDLGQQIAHHAVADSHYLPVGFFDDFQAVGAMRHGLPVLGGVEDVLRLYRQGQFECLMIGIGYHHLGFKRQLYERFAGSVPFGTLVHSSCIVDPSAQVGEGSIVYPGGILDMNVAIGPNTLLNIGCRIAHDTRIGATCFLSPGVNVAGFVDVAGEVVLGIGTIVIDNIKIASGVRTAGGTVVTRHLADPGLYAGVPAVWKKA